MSHTLLLGKSTIPSAGRGCFLASGSVLRGGIVTLYPGMVYCSNLLPALSLDLGDEAFDTMPPFFMVGNSYLLRVTADDDREYLVDGSPRGLSALLFSAAAATAREASVPVNSSWLDPAVRACSMECSTSPAASSCLDPNGQAWGSACSTASAGSSCSGPTGQAHGTACSTLPGSIWLDVAAQASSTQCSTSRAGSGWLDPGDQPGRLGGSTSTSPASAQAGSTGCNVVRGSIAHAQEAAEECCALSCGTALAQIGCNRGLPVASAAPPAGTALPWGGRAALKHNAFETAAATSEVSQCGGVCLGRQVALGNMVNHPSHGRRPNIEFQAVTLPDGFPGDLLRLVPTLPDQTTCAPRVVVLMMALENLWVEPGGPPVELLMDYGVDPVSVGYNA